MILPVENRTNLKNNWSQCHAVRQKSHMGGPGYMSVLFKFHSDSTTTPIVLVTSTNIHPAKILWACLANYIVLFKETC
jgi:hypothetical protein